MTDPADDGGLHRLTELLWDQEVFHQRVLAELLATTDLARRIGLWDFDEPPTVTSEPLRGLFDLALSHTRHAAAPVYVELKVGSELSDNQFERQAAGSGSVRRAYLLLGRTYFQWRDRQEVRVVGVIELANALDAITVRQASAGAAIAGVYRAALAAEAKRWVAPLTPDSPWSGLEYYRFYDEIRSTWPAGSKIYAATNPAGPDWILNPWDWRPIGGDRWRSATFYWEIVQARCRFKIEWRGPREDAGEARAGYLMALLDAGAALGASVVPTRSRPGTFMGAADLGGDLRRELIAGGAVRHDAARAVYERATAVFEEALRHLSPGA